MDACEKHGVVSALQGSGASCWRAAAGLYGLMQGKEVKA